VGSCVATTDMPWVMPGILLARGAGFVLTSMVGFRVATLSAPRRHLIPGGLIDFG